MFSNMRGTIRRYAPSSSRFPISSPCRPPPAQAPRSGDRAWCPTTCRTSRRSSSRRSSSRAPSLPTPSWLLNMPPDITAATGMDALTHNIESYLSPEYHPLCDGIALEGVRIAARALPIAVRDGANLQARSDMMMASMMGAIAFQKDLGAVHSCAHALSTVADLHHGLANGIMIDHVMRFNLSSAAGKMAEARASGRRARHRHKSGSRCSAGLHRLARQPQGRDMAYRLRSPSSRARAPSRVTTSRRWSTWRSTTPATRPILVSARARISRRSSRRQCNGSGPNVTGSPLPRGRREPSFPREEPAPSGIIGGGNPASLSCALSVTRYLC